MNQPTATNDALSRLITAAAALAEYVRPNRMKHITEVKLIEALDAYRASPVSETAPREGIVVPLSTAMEAARRLTESGLIADNLVGARIADEIQKQT